MMLNKRRQELIIQNLKSISSQVRLMAVEQLVNLPSMPPAEKIKQLESCLQDSDDSVKAAAKTAIAKLGGGGANSSSSASSHSMSANPGLSSAKNDSGSGFSLPDLGAVDSSTTHAPEVSLPSPSLLHENISSVQSDSKVNTFANTDVSSETNNSAGISAPLQPAPVLAAKTGVIDGPVDPSMPTINGQTDIGFLVQHIKTISLSKPAGYLTRLFELSKSMHEEVALTALQALLNAKDKRVPPHILDLLNVPGYSSQRRFLMLKIIMEFDIPFNSDLLENILVKEKDVIVKSGLVKVFARNCGDSGVPLLIKCLHDDDPRVRANTVEVIESQQIKGCEQEIIKLLNDNENRVKVNAAKYLVKIGYQQAFYTLRAMLVSPEVWLRDSVIFALGEIGDQPSLVLLRAALKDPNQGIRLSVLKALAKMNNATSRQILKAACGDPDPIVAQIANSLFEKIKDTAVNQIAQTVKADFSNSNTVSEVKPQVQSQPQVQNQSQTIMPPLGTITTKAPSQVAMPPLPNKNLGTVATNTGVAPINKPVVSPLMPTNTNANVAAAPAFKFANPKAAAAYAKLCSASVEEQREGIKETIFITGADHMILLAKAMGLADISIRVATVKLLSRIRNPQSKEMLKRLSNDSNETVSSLAKKVLMLFQ